MTAIASESVELIGNDAGGLFNNGLFAETQGTGAAGNLSITTQKLLVQGEARVSTATRSAGTGGNLTVNADSVELIGVAPPNGDGLLFTGLLTDTLSSGAAGNLTIQTRRLTVRDGAQITAVTFDAGAGGNLNMNASESVEVIGATPFEVLASGLYTGPQQTATGNSGDLTINTRRLIVRDGGQVSAATFGAGDRGKLTVNAAESIEVTGVTPIYLIPSTLYSASDDYLIRNIGLTTTTGKAGDLTVNTRRLSVRDGALVGTGTYGNGGQAGNLSVNATESVEVIGTSPKNFPSGLRSDSIGGSSDSGKVTVKTGQLIVRDGAKVGVNNQGSANAGNLIVQARSLKLDNRGSLTAATASGEGGSINLQVSDLLLMRQKSMISAEAGGTGNGGNIDINAELLVALENSQIIANAFEGQGGNIQVTTPGLFLSPESKISASSELGFDGIVDVQTPDIGPGKSLLTLPHEVVDVTGLVAQGCSASQKSAASEFIVTGRGGLPPNPTSTIMSETVLADLGTDMVPTASNDSRRAISTAQTSPSPTRIVEAQGWVVNQNGQVWLTASAPSVTPHSPGLKNPTCDRR